MRSLTSLLVLAVLLSSADAFAEEEEVLASARRATIEAQKMMTDDDARGAADLLSRAVVKFPRDAMLMTTYGDALYQLERYGEAEKVLRTALQVKDVALARTRLDEIDKKYQQFVSNLNLAVIVMQKNTDAGNFDTTIAISDRAIARFPDRAILYNAKGEALYRKGQLEEAEAAFRRSLQIDPFNKEARDYVDEIRTTEQAQTSTEVAEWISIAKDKVGDFIVTFLALFAAFLTNSLVAPVILRIKLNNARRLFEQGNYDEFTDLIEALLDEENFGPVRSNFRFMLAQKSYDEAKRILEQYHNTPERLPTLLRILEREHEKMLQAG